MFKQLLPFVFILGLLQSSFAQITTSPEIPVASGPVTLTFNSAESQLGYYTGDLYAHTGVTIEGEGRWQYVIESWGNNSTQPKLTNKGGGIYELLISPNVYSFYSVDAGDKITELCFVIRSADASKQTKDLFVTIYDEGLVVDITSPSGSSILEKNQELTFSARSSVEAALKLSLNETVLAETTGNEITINYTFSEGGNYWLIAEASADGKTVFDSMEIFVRNEVTSEPKPSVYKKGINYLDDNTVALVLFAPLKEHVFVIGDFNNWEVQNEFQMKKDGDYFWLEIPNLEKGKEYIFQYLIDGEIKIADPYTEKIVDPWNDPFISEEIYPELLAYPTGKTEGIAAVLQTGQETYNWQVTDFETPDRNKLIIYELLVRDFTTEQSFQGVIDQLDYLEDLRVNVLELMPVNEFEGNNSWGYNPSFYFAPDKAYGPKNKLKELIDECHQRGIAVVLDMVLNHSYGQSPFVQMYMDNWTILPENPWYNVESPNTTYSWGYDFNHEADVVKELVDSINSFWINEYKVDGFRFDFTKGFTQKSGDGWAYDASRIAILERMADEIWKRDSDNLVILEHLTDNSEETELANHGIMLWGNMHGSYLQAAMGNVSNSDLSWTIYSERGWNEPNLVSYPESHDEERIMYDIKNSGLSSGDYNIKNQKTALKRIELNSLFHLPLPGPKMIWQFGERGYDLSINRCEDGSISNDCRTYPKPPYWHYLNNTDRLALFNVMAKLNELKQKYEEFTPESFTYNLSEAVKSYTLSNDGDYVLAVGNFDIQATSPTISFPETGKWYEFFSRDSVEFTTTDQILNLQPGEYRLYSTQKFEVSNDITDVERLEQTNAELRVYPNPASSFITISADEDMSEIQLYNLQGKLIYQQSKIGDKQTQIPVQDYVSGIYLVRVVLDNTIKTQKIIIE
ncbi:alpha-amylase family glycosyl hydrolase [Maribellus sediminis]|uniref:alpha-amylase family glycosyl hydrolase n=1 Tax=Maribellus sediminis TaxID=2696285 RepID=UPI0014307840|nr:alpha-amylase family glycosyl hydrolase [Maribellus sediminis]